MKIEKTCFLILGAAFCFAMAVYVLTPLLPIYFVEEQAAGGLGWAKPEAFSLFGTLLGVLYASPFLGGLLSDLVLGRRWTGLLGYMLFIGGTVGIDSTTSLNWLTCSCISLGMGIGCIKVSIAASIGSLGDDLRKKGYEYHFVTSAIGFSCAGLLSYPIFSCLSIHGVVAVSLGAIICSGIFFVLLTRDLSAKTVHEEVPQVTENEWGKLLLLLSMCIPYFVSSNQLVTGMSVFLHQNIDRSCGPWEIPALWFGVTGSIGMTVLTPYIRRYWQSLGLSLWGGEYAKLSFGGFLSFVAFGIASFLAYTRPPGIMAALFVVHIMLFIADFHVRPALMASATRLTSRRYHTIATALCFGAIGLGGKLSGSLAGCVDTIGFPALFAITSALSMSCGAVSLVLMRRRAIPSLVSS